MKTTKTLTRKEWCITFAIGFFTFLLAIFFGVPFLYFLAHEEWFDAMEAAGGLCLTLIGWGYFHQKYAT